MKIKAKQPERKALEAKLRWGDKLKIARIAGVDRKTVQRYFEGLSENKTVKEVAQKLVEQREKRIASEISKIL